jgi:hypothetical protein
MVAGHDQRPCSAADCPLVVRAPTLSVLSALAPDRLDEFAEAITRSGGCEDMEGNRCLPHVLPAPRCSRNILTHPGPAAEEVAQLIVASAIACG